MLAVRYAGCILVDVEGLQAEAEVETMVVLPEVPAEPPVHPEEGRQVAEITRVELRLQGREQQQLRMQPRMLYRRLTGCMEQRIRIVIMAYSRHLKIYSAVPISSGNERKSQ